MNENFFEIDDKKIAAVIFDLDGTIYNHSYVTLFFKIRFIFRVKIMLAFLKSRKEMKKIIMSSQEEFNDELVKRMSDKSSKSIEQCEKFKDDFMVFFMKILKFFKGPYLDVSKLIDALYEKGIVLCCLSDFSMVEERIQILGLDPNKFKFMKACEEFGTLKPNTAAFLGMAKILDIDPSNILVIGDRDDTDGLGAKQSGMSFIKFREDFYKLKDMVE